MSPGNLEPSLTPTYLDDAGGLKVLSEPFPHFHSVALGVIFDQGSRDETAAERGITHLVEHMLFKGTARKTASEISRAVESVGGMLNGFTHKESTGIYVRFMAEHFNMVSDLLLEILNESRFGAEELAREREVVFEEIKSAQEDPDDESVDLLFKAFYGDHPLAHPISGELDTVGALGDTRLRRYYSADYARNRAVVAAAGDVDHDRLVRCFGDGLKTGAESRTGPRRRPVPAEPACRVHERKEISQVYVCVAKPAIAYPDSLRCALGVLNAAFGASTSSRLFQRLREDEGLVYSVSSFSELFTDSGLFGVFFITDRKKLGRTLTVLKEEWNRLAGSNLEPVEFETARSYSKGSLILGQESLTSRMMRLVYGQLLLGRPVTLEEKIADLAALTRDQVASMLEKLGRFEDCYVSAVGPITEKELKELL